MDKKVLVRSAAIIAGVATGAKIAQVVNWVKKDAPLKEKPNRG